MHSPSMLIAAASPPVGWLVLVLAVYASLALPALWWLLGATGRRTAARVAVPVVALVTSGALWLLAGPK